MTLLQSIALGVGVAAALYVLMPLKNPGPHAQLVAWCVPLAGLCAFAVAVLG